MWRERENWTKLIYKRRLDSDRKIKALVTSDLGKEIGMEIVKKTDSLLTLLQHEFIMLVPKCRKKDAISF